MTVFMMTDMDDDSLRYDLYGGSSNQEDSSQGFSVISRLVLDSIYLVRFTPTPCHGRSMLPTMTPTGRHKLLKLRTEMILDDTILEMHTGTNCRSLPNFVSEKFHIVDPFPRTVRCCFQSHDLPHKDPRRIHHPSRCTSNREQLLAPLSLKDMRKQLSDKVNIVIYLKA